MKGQLAFFDIGVISIALVIFVLISLFFLENFHIYTKTINIQIVYDSNEAYRFLVSLLSLKHISNSVYEILSYTSFEPPSDSSIEFLNSSLYYYFEKAPRCYKLTLGSKVITEFKDSSYSGDCRDTRFKAAVPIFVPYNKVSLVERIYLNYER